MRRRRVSARSASVTRSGFCALDSRGLTSIPPLFHSSIRSLNLSGNPFQDFKGLVELPNLETLFLDGTGLISFRHAVPQPSLRTVSFSRTPLAHYELHREMAAMVFGDSLVSVNNCPLPPSTLHRARTNRAPVVQLLINGWIVTAITDRIILCHSETKARHTVCLPTNPVISPPWARKSRTKATPGKTTINGRLAEVRIDGNHDSDDAAEQQSLAVGTQRGGSGSRRRFVF
jgi:hypothetical protein